MPTLRNLNVSRQGYGAMGLSSVYGAADDAESTRTLHRAIDLGINFFDTATGYGAGHNETLIGQALAAHRQKLVIASKFTHRSQLGAEAKPITAREAVVERASLQRLGVRSHRPLLSAPRRSADPDRGVGWRARPAEGRGQDRRRRGVGG